jgi:DNA-binding transcriptional ArsR family regulator
MNRQPAANKVTAVTRTVRRIKDKPIGVNARRKELILAQMRLNPEPIGRFDVVEMLDVYKRTATTLLSELVAEGLIYSIKVGTRRYYRLTEEI